VARRGAAARSAATSFKRSNWDTSPAPIEGIKEIVTTLEMPKFDQKQEKPKEVNPFQLSFENIKWDLT